MQGDDRDKPAGIQLQIDERTALGQYANLALVNHSENEFIFDFAFLQPGSGQAKVISRVISSPRHTKRFVMALQKNLERYEERFGEISIADSTPVH